MPLYYIISRNLGEKLDCAPYSKLRADIPCPFIFHASVNTCRLKDHRKNIQKHIFLVSLFCPRILALCRSFSHLLTYTYSFRRDGWHLNRLWSLCLRSSDRFRCGAVGRIGNMPPFSVSAIIGVFFSRPSAAAPNNTYRTLSNNYTLYFKTVPCPISHLQ